MWNSNVPGCCALTLRELQKQNSGKDGKNEVFSLFSTWDVIHFNRMHSHAYNTLMMRSPRALKTSGFTISSQFSGRTVLRSPLPPRALPFRNQPHRYQRPTEGGEEPFLPEPGIDLECSNPERSKSESLSAEQVTRAPGSPSGHMRHHGATEEVMHHWLS